MMNVVLAVIILGSVFMLLGVVEPDSDRLAGLRLCTARERRRRRLPTEGPPVSGAYGRLPRGRPGGVGQRHDDDLLGPVLRR